jgi:hypothetical protein
MEGLAGAGYITVYGHHAGDPRYVLVLDYSACVLTLRDAARAKMNATPFVTPSAMSERERELVHEAWACRPGVQRGGAHS